jgi:hypothetical protein
VVSGTASRLPRKRTKKFGAARRGHPRACGKPIELWWQDEARVGQQGSLTYVWAEKGGRPRAPRDQRYEWACLFGTVYPAHGIGAALVLPGGQPEPRLSTPRQTNGAHLSDADLSKVQNLTLAQLNQACGKPKAQPPGLTLDKLCPPP